MFTTIEDCLELAMGLTRAESFDIDSSDYTIMNSIARQVFKGTALTDRQYALMTEKLTKYKDQFNAHDGDFDLAVESLRKPLRHIDRSQYICVVDHLEMTGRDRVYESYKQHWQWIKIRFPFSKKNIVGIEQCSRGLGQYYYHEKGSHEHYFRFHELTAYRLVKEFKDRNFKIDQTVLDYAARVEQIIENETDYLPGVYNYELCNVHNSLKDYCKDTFGKPDKNNLVLYKDRSKMLGIKHFDSNELEEKMQQISPLTKKIINRSEYNVQIDPREYNIDKITFSLYELKRFPLLVILDEEKALDQLTQVHQHFRNIVETHSVLFRMENHKDPEFNQYIKRNELNYPLDNNPEIVYISKDKLPKPLLKSSWKPCAVLLMSSTRMFTKSKDWIDGCDLTIHFDEEQTQFMRFGTEKIIRI